MGITVSYLTLAGAEYGKPPRHGILARARAAADAGIASLGADLSDLPELTRHGKEIRSLVSIDECEWIDLGTERPYNGMQKLLITMLADDFGTSRVNCGVCDVKTRADQAARVLERLAGHVQELGMTVAVEPVAFGSLPLTIDIADVLSLAGSPENAGMLVDCWQVTQGYLSEKLPQRAAWPVAGIQLCGPTRRQGLGLYPWTTREASQERRSLAEWPGWDFAAWLEEFNVTGAPVSYEVPRSDWRAMPLADVARMVADDIRTLGG